MRRLFWLLIFLSSEFFPARICDLQERVSRVQRNTIRCNNENADQQTKFSFMCHAYEQKWMQHTPACLPVSHTRNNLNVTALRTVNTESDAAELKLAGNNNMAKKFIQQKNDEVSAMDIIVIVIIHCFVVGVTANALRPCLTAEYSILKSAGWSCNEKTTRIYMKRSLHFFFSRCVCCSSLTACSFAWCQSGHGRESAALTFTTVCGHLSHLSHCCPVFYAAAALSIMCG